MTPLNLGRSFLRSCGQVSRAHRQQPLRLRPSIATRRYASLKSQGIEEAPPLDDKAIAAPELDFEALVQRFILAKHARPLPVSPSYFGRQTTFHDSYVVVQKLYNLYLHLPTMPKAQAERIVWKRLEDYRKEVGEEVKATEYKSCITLVRRLHLIHPDLKPPDVTEAITDFMKDHQLFMNQPKVIKPDGLGRALGTGRRKTSMARAWIVEGTGEVLVNGKSLAEVFGRVHDRESAVWALKATDRLDKYNVWALVEGGGTTGQAEALTLAVGQGLLAHEPALKPALRRAGCVTRDRREVERKKHGRVKARKMPAWVKR